MHFTTISLIAASAALVSAETKTYVGPLSAGSDAQALKGCVDALSANPIWNNGYTCGDHHFELAGSHWNSAADCVGACTPFLIGAASSGADWAKCDQQTGVSAHCWVGWSPLGAHMCDNGDGSPCA